jgi:hypothetical protein
MNTTMQTPDPEDAAALRTVAAQVVEFATMRGRPNGQA